jgi:hypothetical protein
MDAVPVPLNDLKPCNAGCNIIFCFNLESIMEEINFQIVSREPISLNPPLPFGIATNTDHFSSSGKLPV